MQLLGEQVSVPQFVGKQTTDWLKTICKVLLAGSALASGYQLHNDATKLRNSPWDAYNNATSYIQYYR
jgi:hypothetical protein